MASIIIPGRRAFLAAIGATAFFSTRGAFAEALTATAATTEGPFYPDKMPLDTDNDLILINDSITPAVGDVTWLSGRVLTSAGSPVRNAYLEIWQCDAHQSYLHSSGRGASVDGNFQGYGRYLTDSSGRYLFRTIKPVPYKLQDVYRAPHIHLAMSQNGRRLFTTQIAIRGHRDNAADRVFKPLKPDDFNTLVTDFSPLPGSRAGELTASFDLVLGSVAIEDDDGVLRGGIGKKVGTAPRGNQ